MHFMTRAQKALLSVILIISAICLTYLPFEAEYIRKGDNSKAYLGYHFAWAPPNVVDVCVNTFGMATFGPLRPDIPNTSWGDLSAERILQDAHRRCFIRPNYIQALATASILAMLAIVAALLLGLKSKVAKRTEALEGEPNRDTLAPQAPAKDNEQALNQSSELGRENWLLVNEFGQSRTYLNKDSIVKRDQLVAVDTRYELDPYGTDKRNNRRVKQMLMREEYDVSKDSFRAHRLSFVYGDDSLSQPLKADTEWKPASGGHAKTLAFLKNLLSTQVDA